MASVRGRGQLPVGSMQWINDENAQVAQFCGQEAEDFAISARNEVEWLNEHMAEIFSKNQVNVTEIFKTPGKLRGKTPRTLKKRNPLQNREPLTDIFSTNAGHYTNPTYPQQGKSPDKHAPTFKVAEDTVFQPVNKQPKKANTDSGYHGQSSSVIEIDQQIFQSTSETAQTLIDPQCSPLRPEFSLASRSEDRSTAEPSFHSAREDITRKDVMDIAIPPTEMEKAGLSPKDQTDVPNTQYTSEDAMELDVMKKELDEDLVVDESRSPSQGSSPARPMVRKSSLSFAALPAREPLTTKKSIGARVSRTSQLEHHKGNVQRGSFLGRFTGGKSLGGTKQRESAQDDFNDNMDVDTDSANRPPPLTQEESDGEARITKLHNKSSTQRLHERINLLGKSQSARPTKSIPAVPANPQPTYPDLPNAETQHRNSRPSSNATSKLGTLQASNDDEDDWIQPPQPPTHAPNRPQLSKSISADVMEGIRGKQAISDEDFGLLENRTGASKDMSSTGPFDAANGNQEFQRRASASQHESPKRSGSSGVEKPANDATTSDVKISYSLNESTTPIGSPSSKRYVDGPLSASKFKLQSIMKTARGLFSSSAGVSAQAKMETLSPTLMHTQGQSQIQSLGKGLAGKNTAKAAEAREGLHTVSKMDQSLHDPVKNADTRKTRSSTEKEERQKQKEAVERQRDEAHHDQGPEQGCQKTAGQNQASKSTRTSPRKTQNQEPPTIRSDAGEGEIASQTMAPPLPNAHGRPSQLQRPKDARRPIKPAKEPAPKPKPQPVAIRVGTLGGQRIPLTNAALSSSLQDSLPPPQPKQQPATKKPSLQTSASNVSLKSSVTSATAKPKALIAAERKKEQDEKEAQRKLEQKREIERKRAAQQEEVKRHEQMQRQEAERQRERERVAAAEDPKKTAHRQAIEKRRMELNKKDQNRMPQRPNTDRAPAAQPAYTGSTTRPEMGGARPPSRPHNIPDHNRPVNSHYAANPSKPQNKRIFDPEADDAHARPTRPQGGPSYQQNEGKRRRTEDEEPEEFPIRPTMAPPIRQSGIRKDGPKPSVFGSNYTTAPPPAPHHGNAPSLLKQTTSNQAYQQQHIQNQLSRPGYHPDVAKYTNGKIPFADAPNPPQSHKTPLPTKLAPPPAKPSPQYQNGENIHLDDIPTESEDSESESESSKPKPANLPDWAQSPNLRQLLMTQDEDMDADAVFGPVASPHMEEMFRERHHRFRSRTSSANWAGADRLTEEEIRRDVEARQRLRREGGWSFGL